MDCKDCSLKFNSKEELYKHFRTDEHSANMIEEDSEDEDETPSNMLLMEQSELVKQLDKHYKTFDAGTSIDGYGKVRRLLANLNRAEKLQYALTLRYMDDFDIKRGDNKICRCGDKFIDTDSLIKHQINCKYTQNTSCNLCGKTFADQYILKAHRKKCVPVKDKEFIVFI